MANIQNITDENFEDIVLNSEKVFVLDFFSDWCLPCKTMGPVFEELVKDFDDRVSFGKIDISGNTQTPTKYNVLSIPTFIMFKGGQEIRRLTGITPKEKFKTEIEKLLSKRR